MVRRLFSKIGEYKSFIIVWIFLGEPFSTKDMIKYIEKYPQQIWDNVWLLEDYEMHDRIWKEYKQYLKSGYRKDWLL